MKVTIQFMCVAILVQYQLDGVSTNLRIDPRRRNAARAYRYVTTNIRRLQLTTIDRNMSEGERERERERNEMK